MPRRCSPKRRPQPAVFDVKSAVTPMIGTTVPKSGGAGGRTRPSGVGNRFPDPTFVDLVSAPCSVGPHDASQGAGNDLQLVPAAAQHHHRGDVAERLRLGGQVQDPLAPHACGLVLRARICVCLCARARQPPKWASLHLGARLLTSRTRCRIRRAFRRDPAIRDRILLWSRIVYIWSPPGGSSRRRDRSWRRLLTTPHDDFS